MVDGAGGRGGRCVHGGDRRMGADEADGRMSERADGTKRAQMVGRTGAERVRIVEWTGGRGSQGADGRTSGLGGWGLHCTDGGSVGRADGRTGRSKAEGPRSGGLGGPANWGGWAY